MFGLNITESAIWIWFKGHRCHTVQKTIPRRTMTPNENKRCHIRLIDDMFRVWCRLLDVGKMEETRRLFAHHPEMCNERVTWNISMNQLRPFKWRAEWKQQIECCALNAVVGLHLPASRVSSRPSNQLLRPPERATSSLVEKFSRPINRCMFHLHLLLTTGRFNRISGQVELFRHFVRVKFT